jgi:beta-N-acetylhexosaminidase
VQVLQHYTLLILTLLVLMSLDSGGLATVKAQEETVDVDTIVEQIFEILTPQERVGQLFMVSFRGTDISATSEIAELIQQYRVGGIFISAKNKNFTNDPTTPNQVLKLTNGLQALARGEVILSIQDHEDELSQLPVTPTNAITASATLTTPFTTLPLFIAVNHEGDGYPYTDIREGLTDIPNEMGLGATWNTENARLIGQIVGQELSLLGINMILGPSLDVLDNPRPERDGSLGTRTFGGSPYWVGKMGQAYIQGIHQGSKQQVLTIAKHFPGFGSSDREINQGVPTILKSLDDLRRKELVPFFEVTQIDPELPDKDSITDGLLTAHIRYRGLQGNVPISLDARNLPAILALKEFAAWREAGGLVISAPLGVPAALEGATTTDSFPARRLASDALWAGSDILMVTDFAFDNTPAEEMANIKNAIVFFQDKYNNDTNFRAAVDKAVRRIIKAKLKIYGQNLLNVSLQRSPMDLEQLNKIGKAVDLDKIAQAGVTLITPSAGQSLAPLTGPPQPDDKILIFTDDRVARDCADCPAFVLVRTTALEEIILRLFGPEATGQVLPDNISSLSFGRLKEVLEEGESSATGPASGSIPFPSPTPAANSATRRAETETLIKEADWIIFAMLNVDTTSNPQSDAVKVLLRKRYDMLRNKNLIVFAFNAPYFLDETEISQLTSYYVFYNKGLNYLEAAARLLFQQFKPSGALPVGIPGVSPLDLSPDPDQTIQLEPVQIIDAKGNVTLLEKQTHDITTLDLNVGEGILFRTSIIMDRNGNPVPDGTLVNFFRAYPKEGLWLEPLTESTVNGVAEITIIKERESPLQVTASSNLAVQSVPFNIGPGIIDTPTPTVTLTPTSTATPTPSPTPTATATNEPSPTVAAPLTTPEPPLLTGVHSSARPVNLADLAYSLLGMMLIGGIAFALGEDRFSLEERVRPALVAIAIGLVGYIVYIIIALSLPRSGYMGTLIERGAQEHWVAPLVSLLFAIAGMIAWYLKPGRIFWTKSR